MTKIVALHKKWMKNKEYRKACDDLAPEFALARAFIKAPLRSNSSNPWRRPQSVIARLKKHAAHDPDINA